MSEFILEKVSRDETLSGSDLQMLLEIGLKRKKGKSNFKSYVLNHLQRISFYVQCSI